MVEANFVKQEDEDESETVFKLTNFVKEAVKTPLEKYLTAKLISVGHPWPNLMAKSITWLEVEIKATSAS